jgi:hypothetical protein
VATLLAWTAPDPGVPPQTPVADRSRILYLRLGVESALDALVEASDRDAARRASRRLAARTARGLA